MPRSLGSEAWRPGLSAFCNYRLKGFVFVQVFCISGCVLYLCKCFVIFASVLHLGMCFLFVQVFCNCVCVL